MAPTGKETVRGGIWTTLSRVYVQLVQFTIFIAAARVMSPAEFGLFALIAAFIVILNQLAMAGWPEYIMQWRGDDHRLRQTLFLAITTGFGFAILGSGLALGSASLFDNPDGRLVALLLSISVFFTSTGAAYAGVLNWQNKLTHAATSVMLAETANLIVALWALWEGLGILALAYGRLANALVWCATGLIFSRLLPAAETTWALIREMADFSRHIIATRILVNLRNYAATFIIGGFVGATAVGLYRAAQRVIGGLEEIVGEPTRVLAWNLFRRSRDEHDGTAGFDAMAQTFYRMQLYCSVPLFVGVAVLARDLTEGLLGPEWAAATPVLQILAMASLIRVSGHASVPILTLAGKPELLPRVTLLYSLISIACILVGAWFGIVTTAAAEVFAALIVFVINAQVMRRHAGIHWSDILKGSWRLGPALIIALLMPVILYQTGLIDGWHPLARFFGISIGMTVVYGVVLMLLDTSLRALLPGPRKSRS